MEPLFTVTLLLLFTIVTNTHALTHNELLAITTSVPNLLIALVTLLILCIVVFCVAKLMCIRRQMYQRQITDLEMQINTQTSEQPEEQPVETERPPTYSIAIDLYENEHTGETV